ncbi:MAG TPA: AgmX/PglI C-terminal domain-containing protein [Polyangiaceae bacterium]|nr:AgmX/PglI C-terminal domain-containing protein [Polyangiaceae bacterium]
MTVSPIDWHAWSTEQPPPTFADDVMRAVGCDALPPLRAPQLRTARPVRPLVATLLVAAASTASLALLAAAGIVDFGLGAASAPSSSSSQPRLAPPVRPDVGATRELSKSEASTAPSARAVGTVRDHVRREQVREKLHAAFAPGIERDPHTGLTLPSGAGAAAGTSNLSATYLQQRIRDDFYPLAVACYEAALVQEPKLRGKIVIDFMIVGDVSVGGIVDQAKINGATDIQNPELRECMLQSMLSMVFEPPESGGWVTVTYPFELSPD